MEIRIETQPVSKQVAAIRPLAAERVETDPVTRPAQKNQRRRRSGEELQINGRINAYFPDAPERLERIQHESKKSIGADIDDVCRRNEFHRVQDKTVLFENQELDILPPY